VYLKNSQKRSISITKLKQFRCGHLIGQFELYAEP